MPNALLSDLFNVTLPTGSINIGAAINVGAGQFIAIRLIYPNGTVAISWDPAYLLYNEGSGTYVGTGTYAMTFGFFYLGGAFQRVWVGAS